MTTVASKPTTDRQSFSSSKVEPATKFQLVADQAAWLMQNPSDAQFANDNGVFRLESAGTTYSLKLVRDSNRLFLICAQGAHADISGATANIWFLEFQGTGSRATT